MGLDGGYDYFSETPLKTFLICPIRDATKQQIKECADIVESLEAEGFIVHWPYRDTDQNCETGYNICEQNRNAIRDADVVHIVYDKNSSGSHFDLGCAFAFHKKIIPLSLPEETEGKSFPNMVRQWAKK